MKQPNLTEKIIIMTLEGISMGILSAVHAFIDLILRLLFGPSTFADYGQSNNLSLPIYDTMKIKICKSGPSVDFTNHKSVDREMKSEGESNVAILLSNGKSGFTEAKGWPLFRGLLPNDISILCRYWYANKFDCIIVL